MKQPTRKEGMERAQRSKGRSVHERTIRLLARRAHGMAELKQKLIAKGESPAQVQSELEDCRERGLLDDTAFAYQRTMSRIAGKGYGPVRVRGELLGLGLDPEDVARGMARALEELDLDAVLAGVLEKRCGKWQREGGAADDRHARKRCFDLLYRRGFDIDTIHRVLS
ncbi:MAG: RecX family transcriptional regulator [Magnetococcales bacterium]|nr:RecX family transcriptional regulator [Magnetococcales bacterium]